MPLLQPLPACHERSAFVAQVSDEARLREAWYRIQRRGKAPGVDGMTVDHFRADAENRLARLRQQLRNGTYRPSPLLRVDIPKADGGIRSLGLPTINDRIAQGAAAMVLYERVAVSLSNRSYAYRPFLGPRRAAYHLRSMLASAEWAVTADIAKFFDNVDHQIVAAQLRNAGVDDDGAALVMKWLRAPVRSAAGTLQRLKGLPQGAPISPVLANWHLTGFDIALEADGLSHVRYADDFIICTDTRERAEHALRFVAAYLASYLRLDLKPGKTQLTPVAEGLTFVGYRFTRDTWSLPDESIARFKTSLVAALTAVAGLPDAWRAHNDLVAGWRNYYGGLSPEMDAQLLALDVWRDEQCRVLLARHGDADGTGAAWFERLTARRPGETAPAGYESRAPEAEQGGEAIEDADDGFSPNADSKDDRRAFATGRALRQAEIARRQTPELLAGGRLRIPTFGAFVSKSGSLLAVRRKKQVVFECRFDDLTSLVLEAEGICLTTTVAAECARRRIPLVFSRLSGKPYACLQSERIGADASTMRAQLRAGIGRAGFALARDLIAAKLANQRALLLYHAKYRHRGPSAKAHLAEAAYAIAQHREALMAIAPGPMRAARRDLLLLEARAASHYWGAFAAVLPSSLGFAGRRHRDAGDVVNRSLNYGYGVLLSRVLVAVRQARLEPALGVIHTGRRRTPALVFDLMEPFRQPVVDRAVLGLIGRRARLEANTDDVLTMRTRRLLQAAFVRRLHAADGRAMTPESAIRRQAVAFRNAVNGQQDRMWTYRTSW